MVVVGRYLLVQQVFSFEMGKWECFFLLGPGGFCRKRDDASLYPPQIQARRHVSMTKEVSNGLGPTVALGGLSNKKLSNFLFFFFSFFLRC